MPELDAQGFFEDDDEVEELTACPTCGFINNCNCSGEFADEDDTEEDRYIDKRLSDREDFHSDDSRFDSFDIERDYPDA